MTPLLRIGMVALAGCSVAAALGAAEPTWLPIAGDPLSASEDSVEVDASSAVAFESMRLIKLRVNRAKPRTGFDGKPYQSYYSTAVVDCTEQKAWHRTLSLFEQPLWRGKMRLVEYQESDGHHVAFAEMDPNPKDRLIKAACAVALRGN
jgi:hypothetical protein